MKQSILACIVLASTLACTTPEKSSSSPTPASGASSDLLTPEEANILSQEEANRRADASIDEANADAELEKLERELAEEGGG